MASRPAWTVKNNRVICEEFEFEWNGGFAFVQKQKNITNLHNAIKINRGEIALEISSKSAVLLGKNIGAFRLNITESHLKIYSKVQKILSKVDRIEICFP